MPKISSADPLTIKWGYGMATTMVAFKPDDLVAVLEALSIHRMPRVWLCGDMRVLALSSGSNKVIDALTLQGISFNFATFPHKESMSASARGQVRYGHDGTVMYLNLIPDPGLAGVYSQSLLNDDKMDDVTRLRICVVCCGQESWEDREANGQMHKLRNLLSQ